MLVQVELQVEYECLLKDILQLNVVELLILLLLKAVSDRGLWNNLGTFVDV